MKSIKDFGDYAIDTNSRVYSFKRNKNGKELKQCVSENGYKIVQLWSDGKASIKLVHRLLAEAYIDNPLCLPIINHIDGDRLNNQICNLEWCNYSHNNSINYKKNITKRKLSADDVREILKLLKSGIGPSEIGRMFNVNRSMITNIKKGRTWKNIERNVEQ